MDTVCSSSPRQPSPAPWLGGLVCLLWLRDARDRGIDLLSDQFLPTFCHLFCRPTHVMDTASLQIAL